MGKHLFGIMLMMVTTASGAWADDAHGSSRTDWLKDARIGAFMHFLPSPPNGSAAVAAFDVDALARQLDSIGARYFVFTLGQNSGWFNAPNSVYDRIAGFKAGERCAKRDLPLELYDALSAKGIRLMLYLPCQTPNRDAHVQKAFGLTQGKWDQPIDTVFAKKWAAVIHEWSARYGDKVSGWWFDGGYRSVGFSDVIAEIYAEAVRHENPDAIVTFNPGIKLVRHTNAEDYTAGELNDPLKTLPAKRWVNGSQWHALTYLGESWVRRDTRLPTEWWREWFKEVVARGGAITLDMGPNMDPEIGPIGTFAKEQADQFRQIAQQVKNGVKPDSASQ